MREENRACLLRYGPYSKKYMGLSRVMEESRVAGARFDLVVHPTYANSSVPAPNVCVPSGYHPWDARSDGTAYTYRYEMIWKDQLYADLSFFEVEPELWGMRIAYVNRTDRVQNCLLNLFAAIEYPQPETWVAEYPKKHDAWDALSGVTVRPAKKRPWEHLTPDGTRPGEVKVPLFTGGCGLGESWYVLAMPHLGLGMLGAEAGDVIRYERELAQDYADAVLTIRYQTFSEQSDVVFDTPHGELVFERSKKPRTVTLPLGRLAAGSFELELVSRGAEGKNGVMLDFLCVTERGDAGGVSVRREPYECVPQVDWQREACTARTKREESDGTLRMEGGGTSQAESDGTLRMEGGGTSQAESDGTPHMEGHSTPQAENDDAPHAECGGAEPGCHVRYRYANGEKPVYLSLYWDRIRERQLHTGCIEDALPTRLSNSDHTYDDLTMSFSGSFARKHSDPGYYHNVVAEAVFVEPGSERVIYGCIGTEPGQYGTEELRQCWEQRYDGGCLSPAGADGTEYDLSMRLLKAVLFSNVVYPIERHGQPVIHYTPGKRWDSLYTWDSGMIGIGMSAHSQERAEYIMDLYLSEEENRDFAFLFHGSLVPTQFFLWQELLSRASDEKKQALYRYYPMFRRYYEFYAGKAEGSTTGRLASGLLTPYDYFYNASGMDDYPAQVELHRQKAELSVAPVCTSVFLIRIARILKAVAACCGREADIAEYDADISRVSGALLAHSWDEESGYFGYVVHDADGNAQGILRTEEGENYNRGIDGVTPLLAGVGNEAQTKRMLAHLQSERELWSPVGLSTVDMSASYYYDNGYWNGSVWFPYQYLLWKAMFDLGEADTAYAIAERALTAWKRETEFCYHTFEMIQIRTGRGGWYHQFGGLSAPLLCFYAAYHTPCTVTAGFDTWIRAYRFEDDGRRAWISWQRNRECEGVMLVRMGRTGEYLACVNGVSVTYRQHVDGALEIPLTCLEGEILIRLKEETQDAV